jgi:hypothetical protein
MKTDAPIITLIAALAAIAVSTLAQAPKTPETISDVADAWVRLYDDPAFKGRVLTVKAKVDINNLDEVRSDVDNKKGFGDKTTSARFQIPKGWKLVLFEDHDYKGSSYELKGTGKVVEVSDVGAFNDKASSLRWERDPE